ncbi:cytidine deaminase family protein [Vagococcus silagei]|uniref:Cytidine deaminase n=1 Tax=Vagococcus silagei TaxID=2508885 RepID=A0A4S3B962_9ENTE|nr:cytidine deaminase [Vagococcus silagei]THB61545.1 cytidine deaminase [Vagococcus silagei]
MNFNELLAEAKDLLAPTDINQWVSVGSVATVLETENNHIYKGVCIDTACSLGFCAEHSAIAAMITSREYKIKKIVTVNSKGIPIPPCGRCREIMSQITDNSDNVQIMIGTEKVISLTALLPNDWKK